MNGSRLFGLYRLLTFLAEPGAGILLRRRLSEGKEDQARLGERLGVPSRPRPPGPLAWLHGASVGESVSLLPLVESLVERGLHVLVTTGTATSARVMAARLPAGATHQFVPLDLPRAWRRFLAFWRPDIVMLAESELWPNLIHGVARREVPLVLVNARMSERSARGWRRAAGLIGAMLSRITLCLAQTTEDALRYGELGAPRTEVTGQVKFDVPPPPAAPEAVAALSALIGQRPVWLAASTHVDEEALLLDVHDAVRRAHPTLLTIVVPRQPARGAPFAEAARARGLGVALKTRGGTAGRGIDLFIADTIGEIGLFYRVVDVAFIGRSLGGGGGHSPIEAAKLGCAVLHGPLVDNQRDIYTLFDDRGGALEVMDAETLSGTLASLLSDPPRLRRMSRIAVEITERQGGATKRILAAIEPLLETALSRSRA